MRVRGSALFGRLLTVAALVAGVTAVTPAPSQAAGETCTASVSTSTLAPGESATLSYTASPDPWTSGQWDRDSWNGTVISGGWASFANPMATISIPITYDGLAALLLLYGVDSSGGGTYTRDISANNSTVACTWSVTLASTKGGSGGGDDDDDDDDHKKPVTTTTTTAATTVAPTTAPEAVPVVPRVTG